MHQIKTIEDIFKRCEEINDILLRHEAAMDRLDAKWEALPWWKKALAYLGVNPYK
jgi:hypothetical protein